MKKYIFSIILSCLFFAGTAQVADIRLEMEDTGGSIVITGYANNPAADLDVKSFNMLIGFKTVSYGGVSTNMTNLGTFSVSVIPFALNGFTSMLNISIASSDATRYNIPAGTDGALFSVTFDRLIIARSVPLGDDIIAYATDEAGIPSQILEAENPADGTNLPETAYTVSGLLPVELTSFEAVKHEKVNSLITWSTSQEINSDYFQVEGSENGADWYALGKVEAAGTSNSEIAYSFVDQDVVRLGQRDGKTMYYRLRMVDLDRTYEFSKIKTVNFDGRESKGEMAMFPNPSKYGVTIEFDNDKAKEGVISIFDVTGKNMYNVVTSNETFTQHHIDLQKFNISAGTYMVIVTIDGSVAYTDKLVVQE